MELFYLKYRMIIFKFIEIRFNLELLFDEDFLHLYFVAVFLGQEADQSSSSDRL